MSGPPPHTNGVTTNGDPFAYDEEDDRPPYYILVSHSTQPQAGTDAAAPRTLSHAEVRYQYADDPPLSLLPRSADEQVLVLDYTVSSARARSLSGPAAVTGVAVTDAPGAQTDGGAGGQWSGKMYVVQTTSFEKRSPTVETAAAQPASAQAILARFRERNRVLRQVIDYDEDRREVANGHGG